MNGLSSLLTVICERSIIQINCCCAISLRTQNATGVQTDSSMYNRAYISPTEQYTFPSVLIASLVNSDSLIFHFSTVLFSRSPVSLFSVKFSLISLCFSTSPFCRRLLQSTDCLQTLLKKIVSFYGQYKFSYLKLTSQTKGNILKLL